MFLYISRENNLLYIDLYVDNFLTVYNNVDIIKDVKKKGEKIIKSKDLRLTNHDQCFGN